LIYLSLRGIWPKDSVESEGFVVDKGGGGGGGGGVSFFGRSDGDFSSLGVAFHHSLFALLMSVSWSVREGAKEKKVRGRERGRKEAKEEQEKQKEKEGRKREKEGKRDLQRTQTWMFISFEGSFFPILP